MYPTIGTNAILFKGQDDTNVNDIALTAIQFYYIPPPGIALTSTYNSLKACNIYWPLKCLDGTRGGTTVIGTITISQQYNYSYTNIHANSSSVLGYQYSYTFSSKNG